MTLTTPLALCRGHDDGQAAICDALRGMES